MAVMISVGLDAGSDIIVSGQSASLIEGTGDLEGKLVTFVISLSEAFTDPVSVTYTVLAGTAAAPSDYSNGALSGTVTIPAGETQFFVLVTVVQDHLVEGNEYFRIAISDPVNTTLNPDAGEFIVTIVDDDLPPQAQDDAYGVSEDNSLAGNVLTNDGGGGPGESLAVTGYTAPAFGLLTLNADGSFMYTPTGDFNGADSFQYSMTDGYNGTSAATVSIYVTPLNDGPIALSDSYAVNQNSTLVVPAAGVLANDVDVDGDPLTALLASEPQHGVLALNGDGGFTYTPDTNYSGPDSFSYMASDGSVSNNGTVDITVNVVDLMLIGGPGDDVLTGGSGNDTIDGGAGADWMYGGMGNDTYYVDGQPDLVFEFSGEGNDTVVSSASFYMYAGIEKLILGSGAGDIFGSANELDNALTGNEGVNLLLGWDGLDTISGAGGNDVIYGVSGNDSLLGNDGIDVLVAGDGNDLLDGGADPDLLFGEEGDDVLHGGPRFVTDILVGGAGNDTLDGASGNGDYDLMYGGTEDDTYSVDTPDDLTFETGTDGGGGTDTVIADISGAGYYLYAGVEDLILQGNTPYGVGNALDNTLTGSNLPNWLLGGAGNDTLNGKGGGDVLFGEAGSDTFVFERGTGGDVIGDFTPGTDKLKLVGVGYASFADLNGHMVQNGNVMAIDLGLGDFVVLHNVSTAGLSAGDFIFA